MTNPNRVDLPSRSAKLFRDNGDVTKGFLLHAWRAVLRGIGLVLQTIFQPGLKPIADA